MENSASLKWWQKTIAYEIYVSSFKDSNKDGIGDLKGITEKLDYLQSLHVGAVWLTPVFASPMKDNGYDVADYYAINPLYGNMEDMDHLLAEAEKRNMKIIMDLVVNHTSDQSQWFKDSCAGIEPYSDYYIWQNAREDGSAPNNWRSIFGGSAWQWNEERQQYYLHTFLPEQPDLNWANPAVRKQVADIANYWCEKGVGGFRMDAIPYIRKPDDMKDGIPDAADGMVDIHTMTCNQEGILDYLHEFKERVSEGKDIFTVGEANGVSADDLPKWVGKDGVFDMIFEFNHLSGENLWFERHNLSTPQFRTAINNSMRSTSENGWYPIFLENHDQPRSVTAHFDHGVDYKEGAKALATLIMTLRGTPFLYEGEELGMRNTTWTKEEFNDPNSSAQFELALGTGMSEKEAYDVVNRCARDNGRTPMQWNNQENAGFTSGRPWIKVNENYHEINVEEEEKDPSSILHYCRMLADFRLENEVLLAGDYQPLAEDDENLFAFRRTLQNSSATVLINLSSTQIAYDPSLTEGLQLRLSSTDFSGADTTDAALAEEGILRPAEARIYIR